MAPAAAAYNGRLTPAWIAEMKTGNCLLTFENEANAAPTAILSSGNRGDECEEFFVQGGDGVEEEIFVEAPNDAGALLSTAQVAGKLRSRRTGLPGLASGRRWDRRAGEGW